MNSSDRRTMLWFFLPAAVFMLIFLIYPICKLLVDSFYNYNIEQSGIKEFIGLGNYTKAFTSNRFWLTTFNTLVYVIITVSCEFVLGILLALMFNVEYIGSKIIRNIVLSPLMIAPLVAGLIWKFMLSSQFGVINWTLTKIGILNNPNQIMWLADSKYSLLSCAFADIWLTTPFMMLVLLAGIQGISSSIFESAKIDGASQWQTFFKILLPCLKPVIVIALVIRIIDAARSFDIIWVMTQGGPNFSSELLSTFIYKSLTRYGDIGYSSAMAVIFIVILIAFSLMFFIRIWNPKNDY